MFDSFLAICIHGDGDVHVHVHVHNINVNKHKEDRHTHMRPFFHTPCHERPCQRRYQKEKESIWRKECVTGYYECSSYARDLSDIL